MLKHVFFDLDNTLARSRTEMAPEHQALFEALCRAKDVVVVSGAMEATFRKQIPRSFDRLFYMLAQRGNHAIGRDGETIWQDSLSNAQTKAIMDFIRTVKKELDLQVTDESDLIENRGAQIGYSLIGHHENVDKKYAFDPGSVKRLQILRRHASEVAYLKSLGIQVNPGGTTSLDFISRDKGENVARFIAHMGWNKEDCLYVGDELQPGRNDESVIGVIETHSVANPDETFAFIRTIL